MNPKSLFLGLALAALASPVVAETYLGRCKMGECLHYDQSDRRVAGQGSARVPGQLVRVTLRQAVSDRPDTPKIRHHPAIAIGVGLRAADHLPPDPV